MAKSQYTDSITGEVLSDIRVIDDKVVDFSGYNKGRSFWQSSTSISSSYNKFSNKSIYLEMNNTNVAASWDYYKPAINSILNKKKFTVSFWYNPIYIPSHSTTYIGNFYSALVLHGVNWTFYIAIDQAGGSNSSYRDLMLDDTTSGTTKRTKLGSTSSMVTLNTWHHYAATYNGSTYKMYEDGNQIISTNSTLAPGNIDHIHFIIGPASAAIGSKAAVDDVVIISNQILWTSNFTPPNYFLTGDKDTHRISNKHIIQPTRNANDYFDKAYLY